MGNSKIFITGLILLLFLSFSKKQEISNKVYGLNSYTCYFRVINAFNGTDSLKLDYYVTISLNKFDKIPGKINKYYMKKLLNCFKDTSKDFAANLILYHLTEENAKDYYTKFCSIDEWRKIKKESEFIFWNKKYSELK